MEQDKQENRIEITLDKTGLFSLPNPRTINYAENFAAVINNNITSLSIEEFELMVRKNPARKNFYWTENLIVEVSAYKKIVKAKPFYIDKQFTNTLEGLSIFNMGNGLGFGVVTTRPINKDTIITHYAGKIMVTDINKEAFERVTSAYQMNYDEICGIDGREASNIAAFIQDAPTSEDLQKYYILNGVAADQIACANVTFDGGILQGQKIIYLKALRDIGAGEMLLVDYGNPYWLSQRLFFNTTRLLFFHNAELVPANTYQYIGGTVNLKNNFSEVIRLSYTVFLKAWQKRLGVSYEFTSTRDGQKKLYILSANIISLIVNPELQTKWIEPTRIPTKQALIKRLRQEYKLKKLLMPYEKNYHKIFYIKGMALLKKADQSDYKQATAYLLQAVLFAIRQNLRKQDIAEVYASLSNGYAALAKYEDNINYMQTAIFLLKRSIKADITFAKKQQLREYKKWLSQHAKWQDYWRDLSSTIKSYLQRL